MGISTRQGSHQVAHRSSNTALPWSCEDLNTFPLRSFNLKSGTRLPGLRAVCPISPIVKNQASQRIVAIHFIADTPPLAILLRVLPLPHSLLEPFQNRTALVFTRVPL